MKLFAYLFKRHRSVDLAASENDVSVSPSLCNPFLSPVIG
jgi:hypothetical protein